MSLNINKTLFFAAFELNHYSIQAKNCYPINESSIILNASRNERFKMSMMQFFIISFQGLILVRKSRRLYLGCFHNELNIVN